MAPSRTRHVTEHPVTAPEVDSIELAGHRRPRLVVGVDGSYGSHLALMWTAAQARERNAILDIVAVWEELSPPASRPAPPDGRLNVARERLEHALTALADRRTLPEHVITPPLHGPPGEQLVARAQGAELLLLDTAGISSPEIPGGIGPYCLRHSTTPVVFVPAPHPGAS
ncbi:universal stress protein [Streptomyces sp. TRM66268-LWL]|uniref:Universal stress protein n=1 Tax=Streptomyces polyasparticus TaxID=2767826 RepID=A0ABR7SXU0_9ACTN|nr:universal stress protein [Streptomyces polyasparticus]MBC9719078.1 universal stress protein [Streptomyces polyasparticus]